MPSMAMGQLPVFKNFLQWFAGDKHKIDNLLFRIHHQYTTAILIFGLTFIFLENSLDGRAINCRNADNYAKSYCWIHGTGYVKEHLQGEATGCYVDQSGIKDEEWNSRVTAYYLWLPFLLTFAIGFSKVPRILWKRCLEGELMHKIIEEGTESRVIAQNFKDFKKRYKTYSIHFALCEALNIGMVFLNMFMCDMLLVNKFWSYGTEVLDFLKSYNRYGFLNGERVHNPMCELFPTEVACYITIGATTGGKDQSNYLCILSNNLFNQKYFLLVWLWWVCLIVVSVLGMVYRVSRMMMPELSRTLLKWKVMGYKYEMNSLHNLTGADYFMLDRMLDSLPRKVFAEVLTEVGRICHPKYSPGSPREDQGNMDKVDYCKKDSYSAGSGSNQSDS